MITESEDDISYELSEQNIETLNGILEEQRDYAGPGNDWSYENGDIPPALQDEKGEELLRYIQDRSDRYLSSRKTSDDIAASPKEIGHRVRLICETLGLETDEVGRFYTGKNTWDLDALKSNSFNELYEEIDPE